MEGPKYDLLTLNEVRTMDTNTKCNHPPPQFEATKICKFPDGSTMSTFGFTPINCYEKSGGYKINVVTSKSKRETTGIQNICNCTCSYRHGGRDYPLGVAATGTKCTKNGGNICQSCPAGMHLNSSKKCVCNSGYYFSPSGNRCIRDCRVGGWRNSGGCSRATCQQKQVRSVTVHPDGGKACPSLSQNVGCSIAQNCKWHSARAEHKHNGRHVVYDWCYDVQQLKNNYNGCSNGKKQNCASWKNTYKSRSQRCNWTGWSWCWSSCSGSKWAWAWWHGWYKVYDGRWKHVKQNRHRCWRGGWCNPGKGTRSHYRGSWYGYKR